MRIKVACKRTKKTALKNASLWGSIPKTWKHRWKVLFGDNFPFMFGNRLKKIKKNVFKSEFLASAPFPPQQKLLFALRVTRRGTMRLVSFQTSYIMVVSWEVLERFRRGLGEVLGSLGSILGDFGTLFGEVLERSWACLARPWAVLTRFCDSLGAVCIVLGCYFSPRFEKVRRNTYSRATASNQAAQSRGEGKGKE